jgi:hypothetical protein
MQKLFELDLENNLEVKRVFMCGNITRLEDQITLEGPIYYITIYEDPNDKKDIFQIVPNQLDGDIKVFKNTMFMSEYFEFVFVPKDDKKKYSIRTEDGGDSYTISCEWENIEEILPSFERKTKDETERKKAVINKQKDDNFEKGLHKKEEEEKLLKTLLETIAKEDEKLELREKDEKLRQQHKKDRFLGFDLVFKNIIKKITELRNSLLINATFVPEPDDLEGIIKYFSLTVNHIIRIPIIFKLNSIDIKQLKDFAFNYENGGQIFDVKTYTEFFYLLCNFSDLVSSLDYFKENIEAILNTDSVVFKGINNNPDENHYLYLSRFIAAFDSFLKTEDELVNTGVSPETIDEFIFYFIDHMNVWLESNFSGFINLFKTLAYGNVSANQPFYKEVDRLVKEKAQDNILTFLKIRSNNNDRYNVRFNVMYRKDPMDTIIVKYNDDNIKYYDNNNKVTDEFKNEYDTAFNTDTPENPYLKKKEFVNDFYKHYYFFGRFTNVFLQTKNNQQISTEMNIVVDKVIAGNPVFLLGYGASGAGKTSTLIYFTPKDKRPENGILIELCNRICSKGEYTIVTANAFEFYVIGKEKKTINSEEFVFDYENGAIKLAKEREYKNKHPYRTRSFGGGLALNKLFKKDTDMGEILVHLIDTDRFVKATTNNPQSSRSHVLVFVKFEKQDDPTPKWLIVGDFAGVENKFNCADENTLINFLNVKRVNKDPPETYYSGEILGTETDPNEEAVIPNFQAGGSLAQIGGEILKDKTCEDAIKDPNDVFRLNDPVINTTLSVAGYKEGEQTIVKNHIAAILSYFGLNKNSNGVQINEAYRSLSSRLGDKLNELTEFFKRDFSETIQTLEVVKKLRIDHFEKEKEYNSAKKKINEELDITKKLFGVRDLRTLSNKSNTFDPSKITGTNKVQNNEIKNILGNTENLTYKQIQNLPSTLGKLRTNLAKYNELTNNQNQYKIQKQTMEEQLRRCATSIGFDSNTEMNYIPVDGNAINVKLKDILLQIAEFYKNNKFLDILLSLVGKEYELNDPQILVKLNTAIGEVKIGFEKTKKQLLNLVNPLNKILITRACKLETIKPICASRTNEGVFINESLKEVRSVIKKILLEKNRGVMNISPQYIESCIDTYCPNNKDCFALKETSSSENTSVIFDKICEIVYGELTDQKKIDMFKDIIVGVFCVFNVSQGANNPPPVPYIDIHDIKQLFYYDLDDQIENTKKQNFIDLLDALITKLQNDYIDQTSNGPVNKLAGIIESEEFKLLQNPLNSFKTNTEGFRYTNFKQIVSKFLALIDNNNDASAIGTLEFLDSIAKFNTTETVCKIRGDMPPPDIGNYEDIITL